MNGVYTIAEAKKKRLPDLGREAVEVAKLVPP
jgi:hypothetical protein